MRLANIVLDTNAFKIFTGKRAKKFVEKVVENCDHIYVPKDFDKELRGRFLDSINLVYGLLRKLKNKFHEVSLDKKEKLPDDVKEKLDEEGADDYDENLARLAFRRRAKVEKEKVYLVSDDHCFQNTRELFKSHGIDVKSLKEFEDEYLACLSSTSKRS